MSSDLELQGLYVPIVTPFDRNGGVAADALEQLCHEYLDAGAGGIVALGTTGEAAALDDAERDLVISACSKVCAQRGAPLVVGAGTNSTRASLAMVEKLRGVPGVVAALTVVPYYVRPNETGIVEHFRELADASPVPIVLYNVPYRTGRDLSAEAVLELSLHDNVAGIKQAVGGVDAQSLRILAGAPAGFHVLAGDDAYIFPLAVMGAVGAVSAASHLATRRFVAMIECALTAKIDEGRALAASLLPVVESVFAEPNPAVIKGVLHAQDRIPTLDVRPPLTVASVPAVDRALEAVDAAGG